MGSPSDYFDTAEEKAMAKAVTVGDVATARSLLQGSTVSSTATGREDVNWLQLAIRAGQRETFNFLLDQGALGDPASPATGHAMFHATVADDLYWLRNLHNAGASLDNRGGGELLLLSAADSKLPGRLRYYIENGADLEAETTMGDTAAVATVKAGNYAAALQLLDAGASPWAFSPKGHTIGFWLEYAMDKPGWSPKPETETAIRKIVDHLRMAGVPHPPPEPAEVLRLKRAGQWGRS